MGKISLTASMRSNLLSLQNISKQVDSTQNKLSTGKKVNSAIDNPSSYYTALSLNNRADDLNALLDSMGQAVSTIKAATSALESATEFLEQAKAVATQALETTNDEEITARVSSETELLEAINSGKQGLIVLEKDIVMSKNQSIELKAGQSLVGISYLDSTKPQTKLSFSFDGVVASAIKVQDGTLISNLDIDYSSNVKAAQSVILASGKKDLILQDLNVSFTIDSPDNSAAHYFSAIQGGEKRLSGFVNVFDKGSVTDTIGNNNYNFAFCDGTTELDEGTIVNIRTKGFDGRAFSKEMVSARTDSVINIQTLSLNGHAIMGGVINLYNNATLNISSGGYTSSAATINLYDEAQINAEINNQSNVMGFVYSKINLYSQNTVVNSTASKIFYSDANANQYSYISMVNGATIATVSGEYKATTGINQYAVAYGDSPANGIDGDKSGVFSIDNSKKAQMPQKFVDIFVDFEAYMQNMKEDDTETKTTPSEYISILNQYDSLIKDASYKGINLLQADKLSVKFNEENSSALTVQGKDMSAQALGFTIFDWQTKGDINKSIEELTSAINTIRNFSSELGNNYNIIATRQDFTESLINVLTEGADKLTLADMNEESANMLALQTRQQLAINSLSLASQASQSILKLF